MFHENYGKPKPFQNDIALIKLDGEVKTTDFNTARIANTAQITLWLSVSNPQCQDLRLLICEKGLTSYLHANNNAKMSGFTEFKALKQAI